MLTDCEQRVSVYVGTKPTHSRFIVGNSVFWSKICHTHGAVKREQTQWHGVSDSTNKRVGFSAVADRSVKRFHKPAQVWHLRWFPFPASIVPYLCFWCPQRQPLRSVACSTTLLTQHNSDGRRWGATAAAPRVTAWHRVLQQSGQTEPTLPRALRAITALMFFFF